MKKWLFVIAGVAAAAALAVALYLHLHPVKAGPLETLVPENAVMYFHVPQPWDTVSRLKDSPLAREISAIPGFKENVVPALENARQQLPYFPLLLEKEIGLAVYSLGKYEFLGARGEKGTSNYLPGDFLLLIRVDPRRFGVLAKALSDYYLGFAERKYVSTSTYQGVRITSYALPQQEITIYYCLAGDVLLLANDKTLLNKGIDLYKGRISGGLGSQSRFQSAFARAGRNSFFAGFVDYREYFARLQEFTRDIGFPAEVSVDPFSGSQLWDTGVYSLEFDPRKEGILYRGWSMYRPEEVSAGSNISGLMSVGKEFSPGALSLAPAETVLFFTWAMDIPLWWDRSAEMLRSGRQGKQAAMAAAVSSAVSAMGIDFRGELLPALGSTVSLGMCGFSWEQGNNSAASLQPLFYAGVELRDAPRAEQFLERAMDKAMSLINERNRAQRLKVVSLLEQRQQVPQEQLAKAKELAAQDVVTREPFQAGNARGYRLQWAEGVRQKFEFAYCISGDQLILATTPDLAARVVSVQESGIGRLTEDMGFQQAARLVPAEGTALFYLNPEKLVQALVQSPIFSRAMLQARASGNSAQVDGILGVLGKFKSYLLTSRMQNEECVFEGYVRIEGL